MTAFDPTPLRPDAPAMPVVGHIADNWNTPVPASTGLSAREHAAIALCVPDSGTPWLDAMIQTRRRDEMAKASAAADSEDAWAYAPKQVDIDNRAALYYRVADAMLAASNKEPDNG